MAKKETYPEFQRRIRKDLTAAKQLDTERAVKSVEVQGLQTAMGAAAREYLAESKLLSQVEFYAFPEWVTRPGFGVFTASTSKGLQSTDAAAAAFTKVLWVVRQTDNLTHIKGRVRLVLDHGVFLDTYESRLTLVVSGQKDAQGLKKVLKAFAPHIMSGSGMEESLLWHQETVKRLQEFRRVFKRRNQDA